MTDGMMRLSVSFFDVGDTWLHAADFHVFGTNTVWSDVEATLVVPKLAVKLRLGLASGGSAAVTDWNASTPLGGGAYAQLAEPVSRLADSLVEESEEPPRLPSSGLRHHHLANDRPTGIGS